MNIRIDYYTGTGGSGMVAKQIANSLKKKIVVKIPEDARLGDTLHIICEASDNGNPSLTRYKWIIMTVVN